jgi:CheY-like chemotaxis protein
MKSEIPNPKIRKFRISDFGFEEARIMSRSIVRLGLGLALLFGLGTQALSQQDYRQFFKKPEKPLEFWAAMRFEIEVGKFDLAKEHLQGFIKANPTDEELLQIEEKEGMSSFLRLLTIPELRKDAGPLIERVTEVVKKHRTDPKRIALFIDNLSASPEERVYALRELQKAGAAAVPHLIAALQAASGDARKAAAILTILPRLGDAAVPPLLAALDIHDPVLQADLIDVMRARAATEAAPYLWYLSASPKVPANVQQKAIDALAFFLQIPASKLPPAKVALTREAERYYQRKVRHAEGQSVLVWRWDGKQLVSETMPAARAEEYYGLRWARQALELDPRYEPAQIVFLSLAVDRAYEGGIDQPLGQAAPGLKDLMATVGPDLIIKTLDRALTERRVPVILGTIAALGDLNEVRAARPAAAGEPALVRALNFPDRRVQMAAVDALLRIPGPPPPLASARVVEILRRAIAGDALPKAIVADFEKERGEAIAGTLKEIGFEPIVVPTGRDAMRRLREAADIDLIVVDANIPDPQLPFLLGQLRSDIDLGLLPVIITLWPDKDGEVSATREYSLKRLAERYRNCWVITNPTPAAVKDEVPRLVAQALGRPLSDGERQLHATTAMLWLRRLAVGEVPGYDVRPAEAAILKALQNDMLAALAIETAGRLPGRDAQRELARVVLDDKRPPELRAAAANELVRHLQANSLVLPGELVRELENLYRTAEDAKFKGVLARVLGSMRPDARQTGERLQQYTPAPPPAPKEN